MVEHTDANPGVLILAANFTTTLTAKATFRQPCESNAATLNPGASGNSTIIGIREPFYASTSPQIYAIATATVISYILLILVFITPRTFFVGGPGGGSGLLGRRGMITGSYGSSSVVGVGRRPWLQKVATITVAISLTIATADTFKVAKRQYEKGYLDSGLLVDDVLGSLEIRIIRVISDTFLWLAQVQTLIRLFPRHKEKVTIKWFGFALISFDTIFGILNSFVQFGGRSRPHSFQDAVPALSYLFELAISLLYASCVIYYALCKGRFAFWHPKMKNICLVAALSLTAILIPVVFFVIDVSEPQLAAWGDYFRWVGAAAASVVVWEWVERVEALERDERKDGILGREIFDGDEMTGVTQPREVDWPGQQDPWRYRRPPDGSSGQGRATGNGLLQPSLRPRVAYFSRETRHTSELPNGANANLPADNACRPAIPPQVVTPVSRSDNTSAASTVYTVRYHTLASPTARIPEGVAPVDRLQPEQSARRANFNEPTLNHSQEREPERSEAALPSASASVETTSPGTKLPRPPVAFSFKRKRPRLVETDDGEHSAGGPDGEGTDDQPSLRDRIGVFASAQKTKLGSKRRREAGPPTEVTIIPAKRRPPRSWEGHDTNTVEPINETIAVMPSPCMPLDRHDISDTIHRDAIPSEEPLMPVTIIRAPRKPQRVWSSDDFGHGLGLPSSHFGSREATKEASQPAQMGVELGDFGTSFSPVSTDDPDRIDEAPPASFAMAEGPSTSPPVQLHNRGLENWPSSPTEASRPIITSSIDTDLPPCDSATVKGMENSRGNQHPVASMSEDCHRDGAELLEADTRSVSHNDSAHSESKPFASDRRSLV